MKFEGTKQPNKQEHRSAMISPQNSQQSEHNTPSFSNKIMQLQKTMGNQGVLQLLRTQPGNSNNTWIQRKTSGKINLTQFKFGDATTKTGHFNKHGTEFGSADENAYEAAAETFTSRADGGTKQSKKRGTDTIHFDSATDEFSVVTDTGVHRTYFRPDPSKHGEKDNQAYFDKQ